MEKYGKTDISELRSSFKVERRDGDVQKAYTIALEILDHPDAGLSDFFSAAECALRLNLFENVAEHSANVISASLRDGDNYYLSQAYFWRAYSSYMLGNFALASNDLELIDDGRGVFYVYSVVPEKSVSQFSVRDLNEMIKNASDKIESSS